MSAATETVLGTRSEVGKFRTVIAHRPDLAHERLSPSNCHWLLFDDGIWVRRARGGVLRGDDRHYATALATDLRLPQGPLPRPRSGADRVGHHVLARRVRRCPPPPGDVEG
jgi:hypothetical protein